MAYPVRFRRGSKKSGAAALAAILVVLIGGAASAQTHDAAAREAARDSAGASAITGASGGANGASTTIAMPVSGGDVAGTGRNLAIESGAGRIINLPGGAANIFVADPKVVEVRPASATSLFMFGVAPGRTTVAAMDNAGHPIAEFQVTVRPSAYGASEASSAIQRLMPGTDVQVETTPSGMVLTGHVKDAQTAARVDSLAHQFGGEKAVIDNRLSVNSSIQVGLRVRVVEMNRSVTRDLGINWAALNGASSAAAQTAAAAGTALATGGPFLGGISAGTTGAITGSAFGTITAGVTDLNVVLDVLEQENLARSLAEPNLVTMSGETASFLAGGEFPIPVSNQNGAISVSFESYGVSLSFVPTVMSDRRISLHVRPEVSDISSANSFNLTSTGNSSVASNASVFVPSLIVRRADTTVELGSGQSFAIAGLLQDNINHSVSAFPWLGDVPVLGALFRSDSFQRQETELVIVVTPYIMKPVSDPAVLHTPGENYTPPNDLDRVLLMRQMGKPLPQVQPIRASSDSGFMVE